MDNYRTIATKLANRDDFRGNSLTGYLDDYGTYKVVSYNTTIATATPTAEGVRLKVDETKYSNTTSRHQNLIRRAWGLI
jgi:hypothetical protein